MPAPVPIPQEFAARYELERDAILRRRVLWYCAVILFLVVIFLPFDIAGAMRHTEGIPGSIARLELATDFVFAAIHVGGLVYVARARRTRSQLVATISWMVGLAATLIIFVMPLLSIEDVFPDGEIPTVDEVTIHLGYVTLAAIFVLHAVASLIISLSPREGLRPLIPVLIIFAIVVLTLYAKASWTAKLLLIGFSPFAGLPGLAWSVWRHRSFHERFTASAIAGRYQEISRELIEARRVHEALFPPPVTRGQVRVAYRYEPARHIGGDFLFIHPLTFPPTEPEGPVSIVIIDVTGHGVTAALAVNRLHGELERLFAENAAVGPAEVLTALNRYTSASLAPRGIFATALCMRVSPDNAPSAPRRANAARAAVEFCSAGHPPALVIHADRTITRLRATAPMLGVLDPPDFQAAPENLPLAPSDRLLAYTDGAIELRKPDGELLGIEGLEGLCAGASAQASLADTLARELDALQPAPRDDDSLLVEVSLAEVTPNPA